MADTSEAECLLATGAAYRRRVGLRSEGGPFVFAGFKPGAFSLYFGDLPYFHFDLEGRWQRALVEGTHYLRGLDGSTEAMDRTRTASGLVLTRRRLSYAEATDLDESIRGHALGLLEGLADGRLARIEPSEPSIALADGDLRAILDAVASWDADAWHRQRERFRACYEPFGFLPPSAPNAIPLQATVEAGPSEMGILRTPAEFREHAGHVAALYGRRASQARGFVLGGGDVVRHSVVGLRPLLSIPSEVFKGIEGGAAIFLDAPTGPFPDRGELETLRDAGLRQVDVGLPNVSDFDDLDLNDLSARLSGLKAAGIKAGLVVPVAGVAGSEAAERLGRVLGRLPIGEGDLVFLVESKALTPAGGGGSEGGSSPEATRELMKTLLPLARRGGFKVVPYRPEKQ